MALEVAAPANRLVPDEWIDPTVLAKAGISAEEAADFRAPAPYTGPTPVPQPPFDASKPHMPYPPERYRQMLSAQDEIVTKMSSQYAKPPVSA